MITFDAVFFAFAIPAVLVAGISKGGFGSGVSFASSAILAQILPPQLALGVMLPLLMLMDVSALKAYWGQWSWTDCKRILLGAIPGIALGAAVFSYANADVIRFLIGAVAILFVAWQVAKGRGWVPEPEERLGPVAGVSAGATSAFTSFVSHAGGPPLAIYLLSQKLSKTTYQASTVLVFWIFNVMKSVPYALFGAFSGQTWLAFAMLAPVALLGTWLGVKAHRIVPERAFFAITYVLLILTGTRLIWVAVT